MFVADLSVIARGMKEIISKNKNLEILVPSAVVAQIEDQIKLNKESGFAAMAKLENLRKLSDEGVLQLNISGNRPRRVEETASIVRETAKMESAILLTADKIQASIARAEGIEVEFYETEKEPILSAEKFFDGSTMSVHLRNGMPVLAKRGRPGEWKLVEVTDTPMTVDEIKSISREIIEKTNIHPNAFVEIEREGGTVVQYDRYRIVICRPPFSDGYEITLVRPVAKLTLDEYKLDEKLEERLKEKAEGVLIAGAPGQGKSTLASAIAEFYNSQKKIVKTMEAPRDLQVSQGITQYSPLEGSMEKTADVLLLSRPDYTIYDELRKTDDFETFTDMRLAGVGMVGVTHASKPIDAIQRFLGRMDMGIIPQVIDTVLFIYGGAVTEVYTLKMTVKVPTGMIEADLARPVVEVKDFFSGDTKFEIYTYGEETTIVPVSQIKAAQNGIFAIAGKRIADTIAAEVPGARVDAEVISQDTANIYVDESAIPSVIGRGGKNIDALEKKLGLHLNIKPRTAMTPTTARVQSEVEFEMSENKANYILHFDRDVEGRTVDIMGDGKLILAAAVSRKGKIKVAKKTEQGHLMAKAKTITARM